MTTISTVSITIGTNPPITIPWTREMNAQGALETAYNRVQNSTKFSFALQFFGTYQGPPFGPLGYMVIMLNGTYDLSNGSVYWAFYLNGALAQKGIDYTVFNPGDAIRFTYEVYDEKKHGGTHMEVKHRHYAALRALHAPSA